MMQFLPLQFDRPALARYRALFEACFPGTDKFTEAYIEWLYVANPDGRAVGFDAWDGEQLAAHYVCLPARAQVGGEPARVLLSLNTATAPAYQGKGLFTKLAEMTYQAAAAQGYDGVYGVANANSTPGFIRKLGFQLVRPLEARIGFGRLQQGSRPDAAPAFERLWDRASIAWRCANPHNRVHWRRHGARLQFHAPSLSAALPAYAELPAAALALDPPPQAKATPPLRLYIGLLPEARGNYRNYFRIPDRLRPSPLNLIYRSFSPRVTALDPDAIHFTFLDFDAY